MSTPEDHERWLKLLGISEDLFIGPDVSPDLARVIGRQIALEDILTRLIIWIAGEEAGILEDEELKERLLGLVESPEAIMGSHWTNPDGPSGLAHQNVYLRLRFWIEYMLDINLDINFD